MEYNVDEKNFRIEIKGKKKEIKKFARCLVEIVDQNSLPEFKNIKFSKKMETFNLNAYQRMQLTYNSIIYIPNVGSNNNLKSIHFEIMKENYKKAKQTFLEIA